MDLIFLVIATIATLSAIMVFASKITFKSGLFLGAFMISIAILYLKLFAEFIAGVQILIYVGAILVLILFVIMLVGKEERILTINPLRIFLVSIMIILVIYSILKLKLKTYIINKYSIEELSSVLFEKYYLPFEVVALAILAGIIGSLFIAMVKEVKEK